MTIDEARALALEIATALQRYDLSFVIAIEADQGKPGGVWHAGGNPASLANMIRSSLDGIVKATEPGDCEACNAALADMQSALLAITPASSVQRTCH